MLRIGLLIKKYQEFTRLNFWWLLYDLMTISTVKNCERSENLPCVHVWVLSCIWLFETLQTVAHQASLFVEFSRQENWNGLLFPFLGDLHNPGIEPASPLSPALAGRFFMLAPPGKPKNIGVGCHILLQRTFPIQGSKLHLLCLLHCRQILYHGATRNNLLVLLKWNVSVILNS